jgi:hypothetical protein
MFLGKTEIHLGTWGPGNFENDGAAEHLLEVCQPLLDQIEEAMKDPSSLEPDAYLSDIVLANLEIIACLSEHLGRYLRGPVYDVLYPDILPPPDTVASWRQTYLAVWDASIDRVAPTPDHKRDRRAVIVETFDRVERLVRRAEGDASDGA